MGLKKAESQLQILLADTIWAMCKNTLAFKQEISVEGLIGVTTDSEEIFLIPINQKISKDKAEVQVSEVGESSTCKHQLASEQSSNTSEGDSVETAVSPGKKRCRKRRKKSKTSDNELFTKKDSVNDNEASAKSLNQDRPEPNSVNHSTSQDSDDEKNLKRLIEQSGQQMMVIEPKAPEDTSDNNAGDEDENDLVIVKSESSLHQKCNSNSWQDHASFLQSGNPSTMQADGQHFFPANMYAAAMANASMGGMSASASAILQQLQNQAAHQQLAQLNQSQQQAAAQQAAIKLPQQPTTSQSPFSADYQSRKRTTFYDSQVLAMEQAFQANHYLSGLERAQLAHSIGLSEKVVKIWFQNRRSKLKKSEGQHDHGDASFM